MKKHENAIKMLMKNAIDTKTLYGWYEDDNGARLMTNGHLIIKLSGKTLDYIGDFQKMNNRNDNKRFIDQMNDIVELAKKGEYKTTVNIQDVKVFDRYNTDKKPFCVNYSDNSYIGFNPYYFNKLNILTGSDLITIIDSKSPFYMCGDDIECVLLPVALDKNYNSDNYAVFLEELKACYIQDEADKAARKEKREAKKNTETMTEIKEGETINGFYAYLSGREYFLKTDNKRITKKVVEHFVKAVGIVKGKNADTIEKMTTLKENVDYTKGRIYKATLKKNTIGNYTFIDIDGDNFSYGGNIDDLKGKLYIFDFDALTPITFYQDEEKTNAADIVADPKTTNETTAADVMSTNNTDKAATTETANNDNVTDTNNRKRILHGFYMTFKNRDIFVATNEDMKRRYIVQAFINEMINISNHLQNITEEKRNNILNDGEVLKETKKRITPATIEEIWTSQENHIRITSDNNNMIVNHSLNNFKTIVIDCFSANEGGTPAQEKSLKFFSGISRINNQLTETITQDIKADLQADNRQTETTQDTTPTQDKPHKTSNKSVSLFIVTDKPAPVKLLGYELPTLKQLDRIPMYVERFKTDFKQRNNARVYKYRVSNKKSLKKAYNDFVGTVSCYNDKYAIGGKVATGNTS
jgi:hypothetical protein